MTEQLCLLKTPTFVKYMDAVNWLNKSGPGLVSQPISPEVNAFQISKMECEIFNIHPHMNNALYMAFSRYENMLGICEQEPFTWEDAERDREIYKTLIPPQWTLNEPVFSSDLAAVFMMASCLLPFDQCNGYVKMRDAAFHRSGLVDYSVMTPDSFWKAS